MAADLRWFSSASAKVRDDNMTEIEFVRQVRLGNIPWTPTAETKAQLVQDQYDWTSRNMLTVAKLFALGPEGSTVRNRYFGSEAYAVEGVQSAAEKKPVKGDDMGPIEA